MRIVLYNWAQPDEGEGGGVAVYQRNLAAELAAAANNVVLLSAGSRYGWPGARASLREWHDVHRRLDIVNSPVLAPSTQSFHELGRYLDDTGLDHLADELRARLGQVDVFHFQNLEGLTARFLRLLRACFPSACFLLSAHNYHLVCPQVHLWQQDRMHCDDFRGGAACETCLVGFARHPHNQEVRAIEAVLLAAGLRKGGAAWRVARVATRTAARARGLAYRAGRAAVGRPVRTTPDAEVFRRFRQVNAALCHEVFDRVLAVSARTADVLAARGVPRERVTVSYIGTAHGERFRQATLVRNMSALHLGYLGYARRDKGFYFLLDALEAMPDTLAATLGVTIAARLPTGRIASRLSALRSRLRALELHDGFSPATLDTVLRPVNLGVVPVLWEDNLPQVAIEIMSRGIPLLCSDRGGAPEIGGDERFRFPAGSIDGFIDRVKALLSGSLALSAFWEAPTRILTMTDHVREITQFYSSGRSAVLAG